MTTTALELLSLAARRLIQFETRFYREGAERRQLVARYFSDLAAAIHGLSDDLSRGKVPHETARCLAKLAHQLPAFVEIEIGTPETERLKQFLEQACDTERIYREFSQIERANFFVDELGKAVILLNALSQGLFLPPQGMAGHGADFSDPIL